MSTEYEYLNEMPRHTGESAVDSNYTHLTDTKTANENLGNVGHKYSNGLWIMDCGSFVFVWIEENGVIQIIAEVKSFNNIPAIESVGKLRGSPVYASDFYMKIVNIFDKILFSGDAVSDEAIKLWKNMVKRGMNIFVYDPTNTAKYKKIINPDELDQYIGPTSHYDNYRFVLSKNETVTESVIQILEFHRVKQLLHIQK